MDRSSETPAAPRMVIVDTGVIRELVAFRAVTTFGFERLRHDLTWIPDLDAYERCTAFIAPFRRRVTSTSVCAELNYWIRKTPEPGRADIWTLVYEEFRNLSLEEEAVNLVNMDTHLVSSLGPVDVSLIEIAAHHLDITPTVFTVDARGLYGECHKRGIAVKLLR